MLLPLTIMLAAVAYVPGVGSASTVGRWTVLSVGAAAMITLWRERPLLGPGHVLGAALLLWGAASIIWSVSPNDTMGELWHWTVLAVLFLVASQHRSPSLVMVALVIGLCAGAPIVVAQMLGLEPVQNLATPSGLFLNRNVMGEVAACALVWTVAVAITTNLRAWMLVPVPLLLSLSSGSRGALLACLCGGLYLFWSGRGRQWLSPALLSLVLGIALVTWIRDPELGSVISRLDIWSMALSNIVPLGRGLETFGTLAPRYEFVHNDYIQLAFELGVGALAALALLCHSLSSGRHAAAEGAALASLLGAALVSYPLHHPMGAAMVAVLAGLACGAADRARRAEHLLGVCGSTRSEYERASGPDLRESDPGLRAVVL